MRAWWVASPMAPTLSANVPQDTRLSEQAKRSCAALGQLQAEESRVFHHLWAGVFPDS